MDSNIGEILCEAVDTIVSKRLQDLNYNITQTCIIVDNTQKKIGKYSVRYDSLIFDAYSTDTTLKVNDKVSVLIPNGDYNEQKIILNKIIQNEDLTSSIVHISPLKQMLKFSNNIIDNKDKIIIDNTRDGEMSLLANGDNNISYLNPEKITYQLLYSIDFSSYNNFTKLGISADFQTWLKDLGAVTGDYGLEFLFFDDSSSLNDKDEKKSTYRFTFSTEDILGNAYDFSSYFTNEKVINIAHLNNLKTLQIYFYQKGNFKDEFDKYIISMFDDTKLSNNIFVKNLKLYVGYDINEYNINSVTINTSNSLTFSRLRDNDKKNINLYWIKEDSDGEYQIIDNSNILNNNIEIYWARQDAQESDLNHMDIVGANWINKNNEIIINENNNFSCVLNINSNNKLVQRDSIKIKAVLRAKDSDGNWQIYTSNILTFTSEDQIVDEITVDALTGLSIQCDDGNYSGIYFIYGSNNKIIDESKGSGDIKHLYLYYNGKKIGSNEASMDLDDITSITWTLWKNTIEDTSQSMLNFIDIDEPPEAGEITYIPPTKTIELKYTISDIWYPSVTHNTVTCTVQTRNGTEYKASKELIFGKANSQGSNYNLVIQYERSNQNAYELITNNDNSFSGIQETSTLIARLYDTNGPIAIDNQTNRFKWQLINNNGFILTPNDNKCTILLNENIDIKNNYTILQVSYETPEGTTIVAHKPIAIKTKINSDTYRCNSISGDPIILYNSLGKPSYNSNRYYLTGLSDDIMIKWKRTLGPGSGRYSNGTWIELEKGLPQLKTDESEYVAALQANAIFLKDNKYQVCIYACDEEDTVYWSQPIFVTQSNYDIAIVNNWDASINTEYSTVKTAAMAAGKMKDDKFQGIVLGEVDIDNDGIANDTGLYGIADGVVTFSLTNNGQATFQNVNTNNNLQIQSSFGSESNQLLSHLSSITDMTGNEIGQYSYLNLDLEDQSLILQKESSKSNSGVLISTGKDTNHPYLQLGSENSDILLSFTPDEFYLQSPNFQNNSDGGKLQFDVKNGIINLNNNHTIGGPNNLLSIGKLQINNDGEVLYENQTLVSYINDIIQQIIQNYQ